jgi:hypothetical protein
MNISKLNSPKGLKDLIFAFNQSKLIAMDIETMDYLGKQIPIAISLAFFKDLPYQGLTTHFTLINKELLLDNEGLAIKDLWERFFSFFNKTNLHLLQKNIVIFMHNLDSFDGLFLIKGLLINNICHYKKVGSILDIQKEFIQIDAVINGINIIWKDSIRVFNVSLKELCKVFAVIDDGKLHDYNPDFNKITLFDKPDLLSKFKLYAIQDSIALLNCLTKAQLHYIDKYQVDIGTIWSTATLSMKIFRSKFLNVDIPTLNNTVDHFIRRGYYGGATDYYMKYGENLRYYDVNSLYPYAMLNPMPLNLIKYYNNLDYFNLKDLFGFFLVEIECPKNIKYHQFYLLCCPKHFYLF